MRAPNQQSDSRVSALSMDYVEAPGTAVLFLPGLFAGGWLWDATIAELRAEGRACARVLKALAEIDCGVPPLSRTVQALTALVESLPNDRIIIVANSLGGLLGLELATQCPRVIGIVLSGCPGLSEAVNIGLTRTRDVGPETALEIAKRVYFDRELIADSAVTQCAEVICHRDNTSRIMRWLISTRDYPMKDKLLSYKGTLHCIWGEQDAITPMLPWKDLAEQSGTYCFDFIAGCGHSPMLEQPRLFNEKLRVALSAMEEHVHTAPIRRVEAPSDALEGPVSV